MTLSTDPHTVPPRGAVRTPPRVLAISVPNLLTYLRILAVPALVGCLLLLDGPWRNWSAFAVFAFASVTDWLDGFLARVWAQQSSLGRMLDPIADKLLVAAALLLLVYDHTIQGPSVVAAVIIQCREILVSGLREFLAELQVKVHVTWLAKWKTAVQMAAIAILLTGEAGERVLPGAAGAGLVMLWLAALLTLWTGYDYLKSTVSRAMED